MSKDGLGFHLQATTPNYPDPSLGGNGGVAPALGCQLEDNVKYSQSFFGLSLSADTFKQTLAPGAPVRRRRARRAASQSQ